MRNASDVLVLCYHAVSDTWDDPLAVRPHDLSRQIAGLLRSGYVATTFTRAVREPGPGRTLAVTFDDACASVLERAQPVLHDLGVPATVFAPSAWVGREEQMLWPGIEGCVAARSAGELRCMDWGGLRALTADGWEVGSHTAGHPRLTDLDDAALDAELRSSRETLEAGLQTAVTSIAYPYGATDDRVDAAARRAGYAVGAGLPASPEVPAVMRWPRVGVYRKDTATRFRVKTAPDVRRGRRLVNR